jgi:hypothetical protein
MTQCQWRAIANSNKFDFVFNHIPESIIISVNLIPYPVILFLQVPPFGVGLGSSKIFKPGDVVELGNNGLGSSRQVSWRL